MEFLKSNPIIDPNYKPSLDMGHLEYFNRALVFAQTNYNEQIKKIQKTRFRVIAPSNFFEEYSWIIACQQDSIQNVSKRFGNLSRSLAPFYHSFWDLNNFPKQEMVQDKIVNLEGTKVFEAIYNCADIMNRGIKLFGWESYKDNFLDTPEKLCALPLLGIQGAKHLARNTGSSHDVMCEHRLYTLVQKWGFDDSKRLCEAIQKYVPMELRLIELILWYSVVSFDHNT